MYKWSVGIFFFLILLMCYCNNSEISTEQNSGYSPQATAANYTFVLDSSFQIETVDSVLSINGEKCPVSITLLEVRDYSHQDTNEQTITLSKERVIRIMLGDQTFTVTKDLFDSIYHDKKIFRQSCLGRTFIDQIDSINNRIIFSTFFGFRNSDFGEVLYYAIDLSGKYQFIKVETPDYGI